MTYYHSSTLMVPANADLFKDGKFSQVHPDDISPDTHYWDEEIGAFCELDLPPHIPAPEELDNWRSRND